MSWTHESVYAAVVAQCGGDEVNSPSGYHFVKLYPQSINCALLYHPKSTRLLTGFPNRPLHLNPGQPDWNLKIYHKLLLKRAIVSAILEDRPNESTRMFLCEIHPDWNRFAEALDLKETR